MEKETSTKSNFKDEVKESRGTFVVLFLAGLSAYVLRDRITDWGESRKDEEEE